MSGRLYERDEELAALDAAIAGGGPALVLVEGAAGAGKSRLLAAARAQAVAAGARVLEARATELERPFPFGVARQLVEPLLAGAGAAARAALLAGSAGLAAPLLSGDGAAAGDAAGDRALALGADRRHALVHGLRCLLANAAAGAGAPSAAAPPSGAPPSAPRPLVALVDDAHWCDEPSLALLATLATRPQEGLVLVVALRPGEGEEPALLDRLRGVPAARVLRPAPLSADAVAALVAARLGAPEPAFAEACAHVSGGNPFLLSALLEAVAAEELAPTAAAAARVRELVPDAVLRSMLVRLARLAPEAVALARAAAILGDGAPLRRVARLARITPAAAAPLADRLAAVHLLAPGEPVRFVHPLVANAVRRDVPAHARARLHARAAQLLAAEDAPPEAVAAQLLHAPAGAWSGAGAALVRGARATLGRGDYRTARRLLTRALEEPLDARERAEAEIAAAFADVASGAPGAAPRLDAALRQLRAPGERADAYRTLALHAYMRSDYAAAIAAAERGLAELGENGPGAAGLRDLLVAASALAPDRAPARRRVVEAAPRDAGGAATASPIGLGVAAATAAARGATPARVRALTDRVALARPGDDPLTRALAAAFALVALLWSDEVEAAERALELVLPAVRDAGSLTAFGSLSHLRAHVRLRQGRLAEAIADARQPLELRRDGWGVYRGWAAARLAQAHVERGELDEAAAAVAAGLEGDERLLERAFVLEAAAELALAQGDPAGALDLLRAAGERLAAWEVTHPGLVPWQATAAIAAHRAGDAEQARELADAALDAARAVGAPRPLARALRAHGTVATAGGTGARADDARAPFEQAVALLRPTPLRLELAHALADLGAARRRAGTPRAARAPLREALALAEACGARPLAERAHAALRATGGRRVAVRPPSGPEALTPTERRVAERAAAGATNVQIAAELFVTVKTVEWHLGHAYRKLGIGSRRELPAALAGAAARPS